MKNLILALPILILISGAHAADCPSLAGEYQHTQHDYLIQIQQEACRKVSIRTSRDPKTPQVYEMSGVPQSYFCGNAETACTKTYKFEENKFVEIINVRTIATSEEIQHVKLMYVNEDKDLVEIYRYCDQKGCSDSTPYLHPRRILPSHRFPTYFNSLRNNILKVDYTYLQNYDSALEIIPVCKRELIKEVKCSKNNGQIVSDIFLSEKATPCSSSFAKEQVGSTTFNLNSLCPDGIPSKVIVNNTQMLPDIYRQDRVEVLPTSAHSDGSRVYLKGNVEAPRGCTIKLIPPVVKCLYHIIDYNLIIDWSVLTSCPNRIPDKLKLYSIQEDQGDYGCGYPIENIVINNIEFKDKK